MDFYDRLKEDATYRVHLEDDQQPFIANLEKRMKHNFRYYQKEALTALDFFIKLTEGFRYPFREEIIEEEYGNIPFYGFEMATGSGKTMLMGASIIHLHKEKKYRDFLIITPNKTIYDKTIRNFDHTHRECVYSNNIGLKYNLITGDNYMDRSSGYDENADFNVYIFNIQKFFDTEAGTRKVDKEWEESVWKDPTGNTITFRQHLINQKLVIITDEAHHYQQFRVGRSGKSSGDVILELKPELVLEYTATAIHEDRERRQQKIIYGYGIKSFIEDGYSKIVRAFGYSGSPDKQEGNTVTIADKKKIITSILFHMLKKKALMSEEIKPIILVRGRKIEHIEAVYDYIKFELQEDPDNLIDETYNEIYHGTEYETLALIKKYITIEDLKREIALLPEKTFTYHNENDNDPIATQKFDGIESNNQEILLQVKKAEEGWDVDNIYTILILSHSEGKLKTYVKQLIGRGVRLFREKRIFDGISEHTKKQQELLHVICEKGNNFEKFIDEIRTELGLSRSAFDIEYGTKKTVNPVNMGFEEELNSVIPSINMKPRVDFNVSTLLQKLYYLETVVDEFIEENTYPQEGRLFFTFESGEIGIEKALIKEAKLKIKEADSEIKELKLTDQEIENLTHRIIEKQTILPSHPQVREKLKKALSKINSRELYFKEMYGESRRLYVSRIIEALFNRISSRIDTYFELIKEESEITVREAFPPFDIEININPETNEEVNTIGESFLDVNESDIRDWLVYGFRKSYYKYNWFESSHEYKLAKTLDNLDDIDFWIRNRRSYAFGYGANQRYYPDFVAKSGNIFYIIEVKGGLYLDQTKTKEKKDLLKLTNSKKNKSLFLVDKTVDRIYTRVRSINDLMDSNNLFDEPKKAILEQKKLE